jgi:hypothetical protein
VNHHFARNLIFELTVFQEGAFVQSRSHSRKWTEEYFATFFRGRNLARMFCLN